MHIRGAENRESHRLSIDTRRPRTTPLTKLQRREPQGRLHLLQKGKSEEIKGQKEPLRAQLAVGKKTPGWLDELVKKGRPTSMLSHRPVGALPILLPQQQGASARRQKRGSPRTCSPDDKTGNLDSTTSARSSGGLLRDCRRKTTVMEHYAQAASRKPTFPFPCKLINVRGGKSSTHEIPRASGTVADQGESHSI